MEALWATYFGICENSWQKMEFNFTENQQKIKIICCKEEKKGQNSQSHFFVCKMYFVISNKLKEQVITVFITLNLLHVSQNLSE